MKTERTLKKIFYIHQPMNCPQSLGPKILAHAQARISEMKLDAQVRGVLRPIINSLKLPDAYRVDNFDFSVEGEEENPYVAIDIKKGGKSYKCGMPEIDAELARVSRETGVTFRAEEFEYL